MEVSLAMPTQDHLNWLQQRVGADSLPGTAFAAAMQFALLWMYFEGQACQSEANPKKLRAFSKDLYSRKLDSLRGKLEVPLDYFKSRYGDVRRDPDEFIDRLGGKDRVKAEDRVAIINALTLDGVDEVDKAIGLLLICYRIRNNLFHGTKLIPSFQQQEDLFASVGLVLRTLLEAK